MDDLLKAFAGLPPLNEVQRVRVRSQLRLAVPKLAAAIDAGEVLPAPDELRSLAILCDQVDAKAEAQRVRRWLA
jgi:hypothetical protein